MPTGRTLIGRAVTRFPGRTAADLRAAIAARATTWEGEGYAWPEQLGMFRQQTAKNLRAVRDEVAARCGATARVATWATPAAGSGRCASTRGGRAARGGRR